VAWEGSDRRSRLPGDWPARRAHVLARDGYMCQHVRLDTGRICALRATDVDHIRHGDDHSEANLQALCDWHHKKKSGSEGGKASAEARAKRAKANAYVHPGLRPAPVVKPVPPEVPPPF
jgi:5-methylcytosine-specific restriction protein A